jgi:hypothetical protein
MAKPNLVSFVDVDMLKLLAGVVDAVLTAQREAQQQQATSSSGAVVPTDAAEAHVTLAGVRLSAHQLRLLEDIRKTFHVLAGTKVRDV